MSKPQTPATPDLVGAAQQTGQSNIQAAIAQALLGRVNQVTPFGTQTWSRGGPTPTPGQPSSPGGPGLIFSGGSSRFNEENPGGGAPGMGFVPMGTDPNTMHASGLSLTNLLEGPIFPGGTRPGQLGGIIGNVLQPGGPLGGGQAPSTGTPVGTPLDLSSIPQFTETTTLSPQQQAIFDAQQRTQATTAGKAGDIAG